MIAATEVPYIAAMSAKVWLPLTFTFAGRGFAAAGGGAGVGGALVPCAATAPAGGETDVGCGPADIAADEVPAFAEAVESFFAGAASAAGATGARGAV